ncbi:hypothetical protein ULVI_14045 [Cochleicola gelatinilyticus]|uniref:N-acetyltransferase domain-containing protein n=2 Tax=Cochleicola gelatinilyticus TaxID=1763537 RepID=A0A167F429_9FLAO|nr:hypothetical protein ULVI_14045 [Cochleicola gelatinilyticus]
MSSELIDNTAANRFELIVEGMTAFVDYKVKDGIVYLLHTETPNKLRGKGVGSKLIKNVFQLLESEGLQLKSLCPFISHYLQKHPEWGFLIAAT